MNFNEEDICSIYDLGLDGNLEILEFSHDNQRVQRLLRTGLVWYYAFHHEEAIECFQAAVNIDPDCAMAFWGLSMSHGPNYNTRQMSRNEFPSATAAFLNMKKSLEKIEIPSVRQRLSAIEIGLIEALQGRFVDPADVSEEHSMIDQDTRLFSFQMRRLYSETQDSSACVSCLFSESLLQIDPWRLWNLNTGKPRYSEAEEALDVLDRSLRQFRRHPGLHHFFIHLMEMSPEPVRALDSCLALRHLCPDAGHLLHMPSHIYVLLGDYKEAIVCNELAVIADEKAVRHRGPVNSYAGYRLHNLHFLAYAACLSGRQQVAEEASRKIRHCLLQQGDGDLIRMVGYRKFFESFLSTDLHVFVRFGRWKHILEVTSLQPLSVEEEDWMQHTVAIRHYVRGIALLLVDDEDKEDKDKEIRVRQAEEELQKLINATDRVDRDRVLHNNTCRDLLEIAKAMLQGELRYRQGLFSEVFSYLSAAVDLSDELVFDEPWGWMQPPRHARGALLLEQGKVDEAEQDFRRDMDPSFYGRCRPDNIFALQGLHMCLSRRLRDNHDEDKNANILIKLELFEVNQKLAVLRSHSDVEVFAACFCAKKN